MESVNFSEPGNGKLSILKDSLAPPQPSRIIKAWERASVPAHVSRLQGQKIWKRIGGQTQREQDKENYNAAQHELKKEGTGARKKLRLLGTKENIGDAPWSQGLKEVDTLPEVILSTRMVEISDLKDRTNAPIPLDTADQKALQFVPRKRTNANHVITPRKPLRQTTLNGQGHPRSFVRSPHPSPEVPRKRKSIRKSIRRSVAEPILPVPSPALECTKAHDHDIMEGGDGEVADVPKTFPANPTIEGLNIVGRPEIFSDTSANEGLDDDTKSKVSTTTARVISRIRSEAEQETADRLLNEKLNLLFDLSEHEVPDSQQLVPELQNNLGSGEGQPTNSAKQPNFVTNVSLDNSPDDAGNPFFQYQNGPSETGNVKPIKIDDNEASRGCQASGPPSATLQSIEMDVDSGVDKQGSKTTSTPRRKRGTSQLRGTRRSSRKTRASSVRAEEQTVPVGSAMNTSSVSSDNAKQDAPASVEQDGKLNTEVKASEQAEIAETIERSQKPQDAQLADVLDHTSPATEVQESSQAHDSDVEDKRAYFHAIEGNEREEVDIAMCQEKELHSFDISVQLTRQLAAEYQQHHISDQDFDLQPDATTRFNTLSDSMVAEQKLELDLEVQSILNLPKAKFLAADSPAKSCPVDESRSHSSLKSENYVVEVPGDLESSSTSPESESTENEPYKMSSTKVDRVGLYTPNPTTSELVETISANAQAAAYEHDETDMLRKFLTRVQANKAAKATNHSPKRKRSLPHSPLRLPLGEPMTNSTSPLDMKEAFDISLPGSSSDKDENCIETLLVDEDDTITERKPTRRSGRTRLPVIKPPFGAPSHIPVRRFGQDADTTVTLKRSEERDLAALTKLNTRKNKAGFQSVTEFLTRKAAEKEDPALRQRLLKEVFNDKAQKAKKERRKTVVWAEELAQYQTLGGTKPEGGKEESKETEKVAAPEEKKGSIRVGIRSKIALGMAVNGTPAPKRKRRAP